VVSVTNELELAEALQDKERFISLESHLVLGGELRGPHVRSNAA
jgi:hypothetical protein